MKTILTSAVGLTSSQILANANIDDITTTIVQVVIGIVTLIKLIAKPKKNLQNEKEFDKN